MKPLAVITLSDLGTRQALRLIESLGDADLYVHKIVSAAFPGTRFDAVQKLTRRIFHRYKGLIYILPCGVAVRAINGLLQRKKNLVLVAFVNN